MSESAVTSQNALVPSRGLSAGAGCRASCRPALAWIAILILFATTAARGQDGLALDQAPSANEPIQINAGSIRYWDVGSVRWLLLDGDVSILQGGSDGVRSKRAVVRDMPEPLAGGKGRRVDIYAEGEVRLTDRIGGGATPTDRLTLGARGCPAQPLSPRRLVQAQRSAREQRARNRAPRIPPGFPAPAKPKPKAVAQPIDQPKVAPAPAVASKPASKSPKPSTKPIGSRLFAPLLKARTTTQDKNNQSASNNEKEPRITPNGIVPIPDDQVAEANDDAGTKADPKLNQTRAFKRPGTTSRNRRSAWAVTSRTNRSRLDRRATRRAEQSRIKANRSPKSSATTPIVRRITTFKPPSRRELNRGSTFMPPDRTSPSNDCRARRTDR